MANVRLRAYFGGCRIGPGDIQEHSPGVSWPEAFHPGHHELPLSTRQGVVVAEHPAARSRRPRRHVTPQDLCADVASAHPRLLVSREREGERLIVVAHHTVAV